MAALMLRELASSSAGVSTSGDNSEPTGNIMPIDSLIGADKRYLVPNEVKKILLIHFSRSKTEWLKVMKKACKSECILFKEISWEFKHFFPLAGKEIQHLNLFGAPEIP